MDVFANLSSVAIVGLRFVGIKGKLRVVCRNAWIGGDSGDKLKLFAVTISNLIY